MNYDKLTKEQLLGIHKDTLEYLNEQEQEVERLNKMLEKKFMKENPFLVENGIICKKNKEIERLNNIIKEVREKIESVQMLGLRSGKTFISTLLNDILEILKGEDNE